MYKDSDIVTEEYGDLVPVIKMWASTEDIEIIAHPTVGEDIIVTKSNHSYIGYIDDALREMGVEF